MYFVFLKKRYHLFRQMAVVVEIPKRNFAIIKKQAGYRCIGDNGV
jgi:hypothetical protein